MYNFIQLTDLHIGENNTEEFENLDRIITNIITNFTPNTCPIILITGDLVDHGTDEEYTQVIGLLRKLQVAGFTLLACPGNHDFGQGREDKNAYQPEMRKRYLKYIHNDLLNENRVVADSLNTPTRGRPGSSSSGPRRRPSCVRNPHTPNKSPVTRLTVTAIGAPPRRRSVARVCVQAESCLTDCARSRKST